MPSQEPQEVELEVDQEPASNAIKKVICLVNVPTQVRIPQENQEPASNAIKKVTFLVNAPMLMKETIAGPLEEKTIICQETDKMDLTTLTIKEMELSFLEVATFTILFPAIYFSSQVVVRISSTSLTWTRIQTIIRIIETILAASQSTTN